ncbi:MAG: hypothetical protein ACI8PT_004859 [Gammaproteobacteria bacterium]
MTPIELPKSTQPILVVVIDTEEEFDWNGEFSRSATDVSAISDIDRLQSVFDSFGIRPVYVMDYPMATTSQSIDVLGELHSSNRAELGVHLHTWVNPPFDEEVSRHNSYQGNLPRETERRKLATLCDAFSQAFSMPARVHKAGRYGMGPHTLDLLHELGVHVDFSPAPAFDYRDDGGPNYVTRGAESFIADTGIVTVPTTGSFMGPLRRCGPSIYASNFQRKRAGHITSRILSKARLLERVMLSPEGHSLDKLIRLTQHLVDAGHRIITFSLHSSSIRPGATTYVETAQDLENFIVKSRQYFEFFFGSLNGVNMTASEVYDFVHKTRTSGNQ